MGGKAYFSYLDFFLVFLVQNEEIWSKMNKKDDDDNDHKDNNEPMEILKQTLTHKSLYFERGINTRHKYTQHTHTNVQMYKCLLTHIFTHTAMMMINRHLIETRRSHCNLFSLASTPISDLQTQIAPIIAVAILNNDF